MIDSVFFSNLLDAEKALLPPTVRTRVKSLSDMYISVAIAADSTEISSLYQITRGLDQFLLHSMGTMKGS